MQKLFCKQLRQKLIDEGQITVDDNGDVRLTEAAWNRMTTIVETADRKPAEKQTDFGYPRKNGQVDYGE